MELMLELNKDELTKLQYPVMVEVYERVMRSKRRKDLYYAQFSEQEREIISKYYNIFYSWYLKVGTPEKAILSPSTLELLQRAINFFGTVE